MRRHQTKYAGSIDYNREDNIHAVQTFFGDQNGRSLRYNPDDNEYYVDGVRLERGDLIAKDSLGRFHVLKPWVRRA
jgi:hypothetical protein